MSKDEREEALSRLGDVLHLLADLEPDYRCKALNDAQDFYNKCCPDSKICPIEGYSSRLIHSSPFNPVFKMLTHDASFDDEGNLSIKWSKEDGSGALLLFSPDEEICAYAIKKTKSDHYTANIVFFDKSKGWPAPLMEFLENNCV